MCNKIDNCIGIQEIGGDSHGNYLWDLDPITDILKVVLVVIRNLIKIMIYFIKLQNYEKKV